MISTKKLYLIQKPARNRQKIAWLAAMVFTINGAIAEDRVNPQPEKQLAQSIAIHYSNLRMGDDVLSLTTASTEIPALYQQARTAETEGGVLIIHDHSQSMDWPILLQEVRSYLPDTGWDTLSIAMPKAPDRRIPDRTNEPLPESFNWNTDFTEEANSRIEQGIAEYQRRGIFNLTLLGYGTGAEWAAHYMSTQLQDTAASGYSLIMVDARNNQNVPETDFHKDLSTLTIPIMDIHFSSSEHDLRQSKLRKAAIIRSGYENLTQVKETRPNSEFANGPGRITRRVWGWLKQNAAGMEGTVRKSP